MSIYFSAKRVTEGSVDRVFDSGHGGAGPQSSYPRGARPAGGGGADPGVVETKN